MSESSAAARLRSHQQEYQDYLPLTQRLQEDLEEDIGILRSQEGWDEETSRGVDEWVSDLGGIWRALRRHRYDPDKALSALLSTLTHRLTLSLHQPSPISNQYSTSPLFHILPLPLSITRIQQPVVVITLREVQRDNEGSLEEMKEWTWWALEIVRRVLKGYWVDGDFGEKTGYGGEGCVLVVDAQGAGYRNLEVELLPTLLSVGHNHFPGVFDSVHVVNAGWTQRSMWSVVKRILPKSALAKVSFLDNAKALEEIFDLEKLPKDLGGSDPWTFAPESNPIMEYCSRRKSSSLDNKHLQSSPHPGPSLSPSNTMSRATSSTSLADIFYTAQNTPMSSRPSTTTSSRTVSRITSRRGSLSSGMVGTNALNDFRMTSTNLRRTKSNGQPRSRSRSRTPTTLDDSQFANIDNGEKKKTRPYGRRPSSIHSPGMTPLQRIKSLSDFHLYLSPSRLANLDLLSDSSSESDSDSTPTAEDGHFSLKAERIVSPPVPSVRRELRPVVVDPEVTINRAQSLADRRTRPALRLHGIGGESGVGDSVRSYSDRLSLHHAHILKGYQRSPGPVVDVTAGVIGSEERGVEARETEGEGLQLETGTEEVSQSVNGTLPNQTPLESPINTISHIHRVSPFSRSTNPWFGYPAILLSPSSSSKSHWHRLLPLYPRNRKRDLVKTLLFLFMLRLQSIRDKTERFLGLHYLWNKPTEVQRANTPDEGLRLQEARLAKRGNGGNMMGNWRKKGEWVWMIIGLVLVRGGLEGWSGGLVDGLIGWAGVLDSWREVLGFG